MVNSRRLKKVFALLVFPLMLAITGCNSKLEEIQIAPLSPSYTQGVSELTLSTGNEQAFEANGVYSDGSTRPLKLSNDDWQSSNEDIAYFKSGYYDEPGILVAGNLSGKVSISVTLNGITSNTIDVNITSAVLNEIVVTPSLLTLDFAETKQLTAMGIYSDGSSYDITKLAKWELNNWAASVNSTGLVTAEEPGSSIITASKDGIISNTVNVTVNPIDADVTQVLLDVISHMYLGETQQGYATADYVDGSHESVSDIATWTSSNPSVATISKVGVITAIAPGVTDISAVYKGVTSDIVTLTVEAPELASITVSPSSINVVKNQSQQLTANANYTDGQSSDVTNSVVWASADLTIATVTQSGVVFGVNAGSTTLTATDSTNNISSLPVTVNVSDAVLVNIEVSPPVIDVENGQSEQLTATASYSDGTSSDVTNSVTWTSTDSSVATVTRTGLLSGVTSGSVVITATKDGISDSTTPIEVKDSK